MTFNPDLLIAVAFLAPVVFFTVLDVVLLRTLGRDGGAKPAAEAAPEVVETAPGAAQAANDSEIREAA